MDSRTCEHCGVKYRPKRSPQRYCSPACGYAAKRKPPTWPPAPRTCEQCGDTYQPKSTTQKFCSPRCVERVRYARLRSDPDKWAAYLAKMRDRYTPTRQAPGPESTRSTCSVDGCEEKHLAKGFCRRHYRRDRYARGLEGKRRDRMVLVGGLAKRYDPKTRDWIEAPWQTRICVLASTSLVWPACPVCRKTMVLHPSAGNLWNCLHCCIGVKLNEEEVQWAISEKRSTEALKQTSN